MIGPYKIKEPLRSKTGYLSAEQYTTRDVNGKIKYDGLVVLRDKDGKETHVCSSCVPLTEENAWRFADAAFHSRESFELAKKNTREAE